MWRRFENWAFDIGRDYYGQRDASISISFGARRNPPEGELSFRWNLRFSWNWLPDRIYRRISWPSHGAVQSSLWTGREIEFVRFGPWRRSFSFDRVKEKSHA